MNSIRILAIETSCDETAVSLVEFFGSEQASLPAALVVRAHKVHSQIDLHQPFGGVVPEVAARDHLAQLQPLVVACFVEAGLTPKDLTHVAVTMGPGLIGALMVGVLYARGLAQSLEIPLVAVNHVDAHLAPTFCLEHFDAKTGLGAPLPCIPVAFPALGLTVSGGHGHLSLIQSPTDRRVLGHTLDDACGEAFDKVARMLGLGYPGGPLIEALARDADHQTSGLVLPYLASRPEHQLSFSYSGIKTAVKYSLPQDRPLNHPEKASLASTFQEAALRQLLDRVQNALVRYPEVCTVVVAGGVAQNQRFRELFQILSRPLRFAPPALCSDNATMIALQAALQIYAKNHQGREGQDPVPSTCDGFVSQPFARYVYSEA